MAAVAALFSLTTSPNVKKLLGWKQGDEEEKWALRAIEALEKKLRKNKGAVMELENALATQSADSKCVTIPRSLDGRLQVSHRKALPHVIYCRVWRWPDLQSHHELKAIETCEFGYENKAKDVCINPYHYRRIESAPILPPVLVPRFPINNGQPWKPIPDPPLPYNQTINATPRSNFSYTPMSPAVTMGTDGLSVMGHGQQIGMPLSPHGGPHTPGQNVLSPKPGSVTSPSSCMSSPRAQPADYASYGSPGQFGVQSPNNFQAPQTYANNQSMAGTSCVYSTANHASYPNSPNYVQAQSENNPYPQQQVDQKPQNGGEYSEVRMEQPSVWASFTYYELNTRVGDPYHAQMIYPDHNYVIIDGYTEPGNNQQRFCLGQLSNVSRNNTVEKTRKHIGRGVKISFEDNKVYIECLGDSAVFVQSRNSNKEYGFHPSTVVKIQSGVKLKIFCHKLFHEILTQQLTEGYEAVFDLTKHCMIRMSFVKGWGADYHRQDVTSTPCWVEMSLNGPLQWVDKCLKYIGSSKNPISSVS
uniref:Mothers against decapentaplegic homolog n=1 Tax=Mnemiopsis leidyi TaxID=27923 RepID=G5CTL6_MNELE|nr:Smad1/5 [Mnemiopsis leidyi]